MPQTAKPLVIPKSPAWFASPQSNHLVHFYPFDKDLITSLLEYISTGLKNGETCIVIAAPKNLVSLNKALRAHGIDLAQAMRTNQYIAYDAEEMLEKFMIDGRPDPARFLETIGTVISLAAGRAAPVRAFGEMVAILLSEGNIHGLIELEQFWEGLIHQHSFSLYCAYPETAFVGRPERKAVIRDICSCHAVTNGEVV